ncbi:choline/glycine/proline betaine transport protein [Lipingzhangella halophila]|uniref:Choline/glycine/proline betaine transport protein n=1 Tax=Lipingzhangella halophila TaxID=1783352 RepID=A0A7W7RFT5_9ACTN|nr:BCCT family transporter [Lipingzhangella halophila]MBB4931165.1 choline/glycine/proline betaine transport protein [Lipingzhangella halophila]
MAQPGQHRGGRAVQPGVFYPAAGFIVAFVVLAMALPEVTFAWMTAAQGFIVGSLSWYYVAVVSGFVVFALWAVVGRSGEVKLGPDDAEPEFGLGSWFAMLFAAGMGIGLVFWGVAEPLHHFAGIPNRSSEMVQGGSAAADAEGALVQTLVHWGLHAWAIYAVVGLAVAYTVHRRRRPVSLRWVLEPLLGERWVRGVLGDVIDVTAVIGTVFGVATSLGLGVSQIAAGVEILDLVSDPGLAGQVLLIGVITLLAMISVVTGVHRGIRWLSKLNLGLAGALLVFAAVTGPSLFLLREGVQLVGVYAQNLIQLSLNTAALSGDQGVEWQGWWTVFYWGWWISWAPFVGVFIARISRGRSVREFMAGVLLVPSAVTLLWFTVFGGSALWHQLQREGAEFRGGLIGADGSVSQAGSLYALLEGLPWGTAAVGTAVVLVALFFVTSSDSGSLVADMLASGGRSDPPVWSRVFWSLLEGAVAAALLMVGGEAGLTALRYATVIIALPFSVVMIAMCVAMVRSLRAERRLQLRIQRGLQREELAARVWQNLAEEGVVDPDTGSEDGSGGGTEDGSGRRSPGAGP